MPRDATPFFLVWSTNGYGSEHQFPDAIAAETEAERLARANPGEEFYVLAAVCAVRLSDIEIKRFK